jgi:hypothetical protein
VSSGGTWTLYLTGTADQTVTGVMSGLQGRLGNVKINKTGGTLYLKNYIVVTGNWTYIQGDINASLHSSYVVYPASAGRTISGKHTLYNVTFATIVNNVSNTSTINSTDTLTVAGSLQIIGPGVIRINTGTIAAKGHITMTNTGTTTGGGTGWIHICGSGAQLMTGSGIIINGLFCNVKIDKPSGLLTLSSVISNTGSWTYIRGDVDEGSSTLAFLGGTTVDCEGTTSVMPANHFRVHGAGTVNLAGKINVRGTLTVDAVRTLTTNNHNISLGGNWNNLGTINIGTSKITLDGTSNQTIVSPSTATYFNELEINKPSGRFYTGNSIVVPTLLTLTKGVIVTTSTKYLQFADNGTTSGGSDSAYVDGPVKKVGNDLFTFPLGDTTLTTGAYHPLSITAPTLSTDSFTGEYFATPQTAGDSLQIDSVQSISSCEYYTLQRNGATTSIVVPTISWNTNSCGIYDNEDPLLAGWDGSRWVDLGIDTIQYSAGFGSLKGAQGLNITTLIMTIGSSFLAAKTSDFILKKKLDAGYYTLPNRILKFKFGEEYVNNSTELEFKLFDKERNVVISNATIGANLLPVYKDNRFVLNINALNPSIISGYYVLEVKDKKGEINFLRIKI